MTLILIGQCPMSNSSELFSYTTICSSFKWIEPLFFELSCTQTHTLFHLTGDVFLILAAHEGSSNLSGADLYSNQLLNAFKSQPALQELSKERKFISLAFTHEKDKLQFNITQARVLSDWIANKGNTYLIFTLKVIVIVICWSHSCW